MTQGIYQIKNTSNGLVYIGQAKCTHTRFRYHRWALNYNRHNNQHLQRAWNKYGERSFKFTVLEEVSDSKLLTAREQFWTDTKQAYKRNKGYNVAVCSAAPMRDLHHSKETIMKMSVTHTGMQHTEETKRLISKIQLGRKLSQNHKDNIAASMRKHVRSKEHCRNIALSKRGSKHPLFGTHCSLETRLKMSKAHANIIPWNKWGKYS